MDSTPHISEREIIDEVYGYIKIYNDGTVERPPFPGGYLPACPSFTKGVATKDVDIDAQSGLWARLFLPECVASSQRRVPVVLHFHGGGLCTGSPAVASFHKFCSIMAIKSESIWVSVDYRLAPEHRLPAAYDDALTAFTWLCSQSELQASKLREKTIHSTAANGEHSMNDESADTHGEHRKALGSSFKYAPGHANGSSHTMAADKKAKRHVPSSGQDSINGHVGVIAHATGSYTTAPNEKAKRHDPTFGHDSNGHIVVAEHDHIDNTQACPEEWLCSYADFSNCFLAGESAGGAIVHYLTMKLTRSGYGCLRIKGLILIHSAFLVKGRYDESLNSRFERRPDTYRWLVLPIGAPGDHPLVNPLHAEAPSFKGVVFPPTIVAVADQDRFYEPCLRYVELMKEHGHAAELDITKEEGHCFYLYRPRSKKAELFYENLVAFMLRQCTRQQSRSLL